MQGKEFIKSIEKAFGEFNASHHHAFLLKTKNREKVFDFFESKIKEENDSGENLFLNLKVFDIEKARNILEYGKANFSSQHFIVISFYSINREAQNALLKFLEEAGENIKIILIIHEGASILPTIYSRLYKLSIFSDMESESLESEDGISLKEIVKIFLKTKNIERMNLKEIKDILSRKDEYALENEDKERNDREILEKFLIKLHDEIFEKYIDIVNKNKDINESKKYLEYIEDILDAVHYVKNNSSSGKVLLEYLSLKLPVLA